MAVSTFDSSSRSTRRSLATGSTRSSRRSIPFRSLPSPNVCSPIAAARGDQYIELANQTGGVVANLCLQDFQPAFDAIASAIAASLQ
jgi:hypothetical protein